MFLYHFIVGMCAVAAILYSRTKELSTEYDKSQLMRKFCFILAAYMILLCGIRGYTYPNYVGIDIINYYRMYINTDNMNMSYDFLITQKDHGFTFIVWILRQLGIDFTVALIIFALIYVGFVVLLIYKYSDNKVLSVLIFVCLGLYTFSFSAIRQSIAMGLCIGAYMIAKNVKGIKGFIPFALLVWIASTIHASASVFYFAYLFINLPYNRLIVYVMIACAAFTMILKSEFANFIINLAAEVSESYSDYEIAAETSSGLKLYFLITVIILLGFFFADKEKAKNDNMIYMILFMLVLFPAIQSGGAMMRIYYYYYIFIVIYAPNVIEQLRENDKAIVKVVFIAFLLLFYYTVTLKTGRLVPYYFFWQ